MSLMPVLNGNWWYHAGLKFKHYLFYFDQRTYKRILEGEDVGVLWFYVVKGTGVPGGNHRYLVGPTCRPRESILGRSGLPRSYPVKGPFSNIYIGAR